MAITGGAAMLAGGLIYKKNRLEHDAKEQKKEVDRQLAAATALATANDPLKRDAEAAARARTSQKAATRALAGSSSRSSLLTSPLGAAGERKTLLGS